MQGTIEIEDGQTLCIAQDVLLQILEFIDSPARIVVKPGGKLNIYGTIKYFATTGGGTFMNIEGDVLVRAGGSLINTRTGGQAQNMRINFNSGTFVNRGTFKNKGLTTIAQQPLLKLENYGTIVNTGTITPLSAIVNHPGSICIGC